MWRHPGLRRALARAAAFVHPAANSPASASISAPALAPPGVAIAPVALPPADGASSGAADRTHTAAIPGQSAGPGEVSALAGDAVERPGVPPSPADPRHREGLAAAQEHHWGRAQRALEQAARDDPGGAAGADLASLRDLRRQVRILAKWPRDVPAHLALGRCYFELGLGADAEATFQRVLTLAPEEPAAPYFLALEHAFRGEWAAAEAFYARARVLAPDLPPFADFLLEGAGATEDEPAH